MNRSVIVIEKNYNQDTYYIEHKCVRQAIDKDAVCKFLGYEEDEIISIEPYKEPKFVTIPQ